MYFANLKHILSRRFNIFLDCFFERFSIQSQNPNLTRFDFNGGNWFNIFFLSWFLFLFIDSGRIERVVELGLGTLALVVALGTRGR